MIYKIEKFEIEFLDFNIINVLIKISIKLIIPQFNHFCLYIFFLKKNTLFPKFHIYFLNISLENIMIFKI